MSVCVMKKLTVLTPAREADALVRRRTREAIDAMK